MNRILVVWLLAIPAALMAQGPDTVWTRHYGGIGDEICRAMRPTQGGGFVLAGSTTSEGSGGTDAYVVVTAADGTPLWSAHYGGSLDDEFCGVLPLPSSDFLFAGTTHSYGGSGGDFWLFKTSAQGDSLWSHTYGVTGDQTCSSLEATSDGGYMLSGVTCSSPGANTDIFLVKTDAWGNAAWTRTIGDTTSEQIARVIALPQGNYMLAGSEDVWHGPQAGTEAYALKVNAMGNPTWQHLFEETLPAHGTAVQQAPGGGYIFSATADQYSHGEAGLYKESMLMRMTPSGVEEWESLCGLPYDDELNDVAVTPDGAFLGAGARQLPEESKDGFVVKVADGVNSGDTAWTRTWGGGNDDGFTSVAVLDGGRCALAGTTHSHGNGEDADFWLVMMDSVYALSASGLPKALPEDFSVSACPNPFNGSTWIQFHLPRDGRITLRLYDAEGRAAALLADGSFARGAHAIHFHGESLASGLYFCRLASSTGTRTAKVVLLK